MPKFEGIIPALITPFNKDGTIFKEGIKNEINYLYEYGYRNIFACGSYGSFPLMSMTDRMTVAEVVINICQEKNIKTIIQIGSTSTEEAIILAKHAENIGADAISSVVPFYYSSTFYNEDVFLKYFEEIINNVSIDVHCYNNPNTTGFNITPEFLNKLINIGLCGIKDGGSDMGKMLEMLNIINKNKCDFDYYPSSTSSLIIGNILGIKSCVSGVALSIPNLILKIYENMNNNNIDIAVKLFIKVMKVRTILGKYNNGRAVAAYDVLNEKGIKVGTCKSPWKRLSQKEKILMIGELKDLGVI